MNFPEPYQREGKGVYAERSPLSGGVPLSRTLVVALLFALASCGPNQAAIKIGEGKLVEVLIDVHIAEAAAQALRGATKDSVINAYYDQIFEIHELNREEFETSMEILRTDPKRMEKIYAKVMEEMERQDVEDKE